MMLKSIPWQDRRFMAVLGLLTAVFLQYAVALPAGSMACTNSWLAMAVFAAYALASARLVLLTALLLSCAKDPARFWTGCGNAALFALASILVVLMRNNGIYAYAVFAVVFALVYRHWWRRWLAALLAVTAAYIGVNAGLGTLLGVEPGETREMLCVPMQQLARVYNVAPETYTELERVWLLDLIQEEYLTDYRPKLADNVKNGFSDELFKADPRTFLHVWVKTGLRRPDIYFDAFL